MNSEYCGEGKFWLAGKENHGGLAIQVWVVLCFFLFFSFFVYHIFRKMTVPFYLLLIFFFNSENFFMFYEWFTRQVKMRVRKKIWRCRKKKKVPNQSKLKQKRYDTKELEKYQQLGVLFVLVICSSCSCFLFRLMQLPKYKLLYLNANEPCHSV